MELGICHPQPPENPEQLKLGKFWSGAVTLTTK